MLVANQRKHPVNRWLNAIIDHRKVCFWCAVGLTVLLAASLHRLEIDRRFDALIDLEAPKYRQYQTYLERFGSDRVIIAAVSTPHAADHPSVLGALDTAAAHLVQIPDVVTVSTLLDMATVQTSPSGVAPRRLVTREETVLSLDHTLLGQLRTTWPAVNQLISMDGRVLGILIRLRSIDRQQLDTAALLAQFRLVVLEAFAPQEIELHMTGVPVFLEAVSRYNVTHAWRFLLLTLMVGILVQVYLFKNLSAALVVCGIAAAAVVWTMGMMALLGITLNPVSSMAFGMTLILTAITVIHLATHYYDRYIEVPNREAALRGAVHTVARPSFMCAVTTAVGFASITICPIPAIRQFGLIMAMGAVSAFVLVYLLLPFILMHLPMVTPRNIAARNNDWLARVHAGLGRLVFGHPSRLLLGGGILLALMLAGIPRMGVNTHFLSLFHEKSPEVTSYRWIQERLADPDPIYVIIEPDPKHPLNAQAMKTIKAFETSLLALPEIKTSHSFFRVLETIHAGLMGSGGADLYRSPLIFQQVYHRALSHPDSRRLFEGSLDFDSRCFCIALWEADGVPTDFELLLAQIETLAAETLGAIGNVWITGSTTLAHSQSKRLIAAQFQSLAMALLLITILLMLQFRSWQLGLLSLIPNFFPLAALFGTMGWFGIPLDNMTIMVAVVSFGLSVDDTVHYFTHLRNGLGKAPRMKTIPHALTHAYRMSAKALLSTSAVIVLSLMTLVMSPFKPAASFGLLASVAAAAALASDVLLVPALILWSGRIQRLIVTGFTSPPEAKEHP